MVMVYEWYEVSHGVETIQRKSTGHWQNCGKLNSHFPYGKDEWWSLKESLFHKMRIIIDGQKYSILPINGINVEVQQGI